MNHQSIERQIRTKGGEVNIEKKRLGIKEIIVLCSCTTKNVVKLKLGSNLIDWPCIQRLSQANWVKLTILQLAGNKVGNKGCKYLAKTELKQIRKMSLGHNQIQSAGVHHLSKCTWKNLQDLDLQSNKICHFGSKFLARSNWKELSNVYLNCNRLTFEELTMIILLKSKCVQYLCLWENFSDQNFQTKLDQFVIKRFGYIKFQL